ncbi:hypothetical protein Tco_1250029, partial [Tanacetum coccineum]
VVVGRFVDVLEVLCNECQTFLNLLIPLSSSLSSSDADSDGGETGLTTSLPLLLAVACNLDDAICLDDGAMS